ncbi:ty3-gypsy retrotransposon protein [Gossypium australe]|uniref:Ty3-gypsy retrotransposon protein n=1 Tax=Gossypium australe TaxID=47621 RepID=A0A5B6VPV3_9ROSI|nr:ty3-gypsy retrotransposon protein [Gossypium australe]
MLRRYRSYPSHSNLTYDEESFKILAREVKELRNKSVSLIKVLAPSQRGKGYMEAERNNEISISPPLSRRGEL